MFCCCIFSTCDIQSSTTTFIDNIPLISTRGDSSSCQQHHEQDDDIIGEEVRPQPPPVNHFDSRSELLYSVLQDHTYALQQQQLPPQLPPPPPLPLQPQPCQVQQAPSIQQIPRQISDVTSTNSISMPNNVGQLTSPNYQNPIPSGTIPLNNYQTKSTSAFTFIYKPTGNYNIKIYVILFFLTSRCHRIIFEKCFLVLFLCLCD